MESGLAGQATLLQSEEDPPMDEDIIIPPRVLQRANARCTWTALKGFEVSTPLANFTATLTACSCTGGPGGPLVDPILPDFS